ncbi:MAG: type II toxin-antitoxin system HicA family toxin [Bacteroidales bacterium]|nr:type II toxin-antitoxin system HicA family toxin [Bacteroidales bacterium]
MKRYKVKEILDMLKEDGWVLYAQRGSHRQFKQPIKKGRVTLNCKPSDVLSQEVLNSILKQAGWKK